MATRKKKRGQPRININVRVLVTLKIIEIVTKENISPLKAWYQLSKHEAFDDLMLFLKTPQQIKHLNLVKMNSKHSTISTLNVG